VKVSGQATLRGPVDRVYQALNDPAILVRTIPGCERLERVGPDEYRMTVTAGVASIKGTYVGDVRLTDQQAPHGFIMRAAGSGAPGTVSADVTVRLAAAGDDTTLLSYDADAVVGGMIGGVGQRMLSGVAKKTAGEFFAAVDQVLAGGSAPKDAASVGAASVGAASVGAASVGAASVGAEQGGAAPATRGAASVGAEQSVASDQPTVFTRPASGPGTPAGLPAGFLTGALVGAAIALAGAVVGGLVAGRRKG